MISTQALDARLPMPVPVGAAVDLGQRGQGFVRIMPSQSAGDRPPLLLLHGLTASSGINWFSCFERLSAERTVVAPDLRGHARGPSARVAEDIDEYAIDVVALLDVLGIEQCTVIGFSMGGAVAQSLAKIAPDRLHAMVLLASAPRFLMSPMTQRWYGLSAIGARVAERLPHGMRHRALQRAVADPRGEVREFVHQEALHHSARSLVRTARALSHFKAARWLNHVHTPTSVVVAADDRSLDPRMQRRFLELLPDVDGFEAPMGHGAIMWEPDVALPYVHDAIESAESRSAG